MLKSIVIASSKGGTGKTTIALNLAVALAEMGKRTLLVDVDPQGAIGLSLGRSDAEWAGLAEVLVSQTSLEEAIIDTKLPGFSILPRGRLDAVDACEYENALATTPVLRDLLVSLEEKFDYVIFDTPSGVGLATRAAFRVAEFVLVPMQAEPLALRSVSQLLRVVDHVQEQENPSLRLLGLIPSMVDLRNEPSLGVMNELWSGFSGIMDTYVPRAEVFGRASDRGLPVAFLGGPIAPEARRFENIASEVESLISKLGGWIGEDHERAEREII
jgi:chromosome partitioning protein